MSDVREGDQKADVAAARVSDEQVRHMDFTYLPPTSELRAWGSRGCGGCCVGNRDDAVTERLWCLSLWQPWASLWLGPKIHETRHWGTKYRGLIYVHAAKRKFTEKDLSDDVIELCQDEYGGHFWNDLPRGQIIGIIDLIDCVRFPEWEGRSLSPACDRHDFICGDFSAGRYGWKRGPDPVHIGPWPYKGRQGLFPVDDLDQVANRVLNVESSCGNARV